MDGVIATAMAKDPAHRFTSARGLAHAAAAALQERGTEGRTPPRLEPYGAFSGTPPESPWWQDHPVGPPTQVASHPLYGQSNFAPARRKSRRRVLATVAAVVLAISGAITAAITTSHKAPPINSTIDTTLASPTTAPSTTPPQPPMVKSADLPKLLPPLDDVKRFTGIQNLEAQPPTLQPSQKPGDPVDPEECRPTLGGGAHNSYDMQAVVGYYSSVIFEPARGPVSQQTGEVVLAFRSPAAAQQQLANSLSIWRRCGGSTMTLRGPGKPVEVSMSVPDIGENGITTMVLRVQGPLLRARDDRALAHKNNVLVDASAIFSKHRPRAASCARHDQLHPRQDSWLKRLTLRCRRGTECHR